MHPSTIVVTRPSSKFLVLDHHHPTTTPPRSLSRSRRSRVSTSQRTFVCAQKWFHPPRNSGRSSAAASAPSSARTNSHSTNTSTATPPSCNHHMALVPSTPPTHYTPRPSSAPCARRLDDVSNDPLSKTRNTWSSVGRGRFVSRWYVPSRPLVRVKPTD